MRQLIILFFLTLPTLLLAQWEISSEGKTVIAIGDIHGNLDALQQVLSKSQIIDQQGHWIASNTIVVQMGDILDKHSQERALLNYLQDLQAAAPLLNSRLIILQGNHELYNLQLDFHAVTEQGFIDFADYYNPLEQYPKEIECFPLLQRGRAIAFSPMLHANLTTFLAPNPIMIKIDRTIFTHAGLGDYLQEYTPDELNQLMQAATQGKIPFPSFFSSKKGPLRNRSLVKHITKEKCIKLAKILKQLGADRLVVGHTPQNHGIVTACRSQLWKIDTRISDWQRGRRQALKIQSNTPIIIK